MENELTQQFEMLRQAQPSWRAEGVGVRGNPVDMNRQQARVVFPDIVVTRKEGSDQSAASRAGTGQLPTSAPAS